MEQFKRIREILKHNDARLEISYYTINNQLLHAIHLKDGKHVATQASAHGIIPTLMLLENDIQETQHKPDAIVTAEGIKIRNDNEELKKIDYLVMGYELTRENPLGITIQIVEDDDNLVLRHMKKVIATVPKNKSITDLFTSAVKDKTVPLITRKHETKTM